MMLSKKEDLEVVVKGWVSGAASADSVLFLAMSMMAGVAAAVRRATIIIIVVRVTKVDVVVTYFI